MESDEELLVGTLTFSGSYVSDDGRVSVRRSAEGSSGYSEARFAGYCAKCRRAGVLPATGEPLADLRATILFVAEHAHGDGD